MNKPSIAIAHLAKILEKIALETARNAEDTTINENDSRLSALETELDLINSGQAGTPSEIDARIKQYVLEMRKIYAEDEVGA